MRDLNRPRLLVLTSTFPRWPGDKEPAFVYELSRRLTDRFAVTVLAPRAPGSQEQESMEGLEVRRFGYFFKRWESLATHGGGILNRLRVNPFNYLLVPPFLLGQLWSLVRLLRQDPIDLIHAHWLIPQGLVALIGCRLAGLSIPVVTTSHGGDLYALRGRLMQRLKSWVMANSRHLTAVSAAMRSDVIGMGIPPDRVSVVSMGVDLHFRFTPDPNTQRDPAGLLFVGRLVEKKGLAVLIEALPRLIERRPETTLTVAGAGPLELEIKRLAADLGVIEHVRFLGMVGQEELPPLMRRASLLVVPFLIAKGGDQEGLGLVSVEAAGCECPVIAGDVPAVRDVIADGETGILVPPGEPVALAASITELLADPDRRARLGRAARTYCLGRFDWESIAEHYGELLLAQIGRGDSRF